jgi:hypothetical protein
MFLEISMESSYGFPSCLDLKVPSARMTPDGLYVLGDLQVSSSLILLIEDCLYSPHRGMPCASSSEVLLFPYLQSQYRST